MPVRRNALVLRWLAGVVSTALVAAALHASPARADSPEGPGTTDLPLQSGKSIAGVVESADDAEVVLRVGPTERRRIPWAQLAPRGVFRVRAALAKPDDGPARLALAELASELGLWADARTEYEKALALGAIDSKAYGKAVADAERRAVETGVARAERAADDGDMALALEILRALKIDFAGAIDGRRVDDLLAQLETRIRARDDEQKKAQAELDRLALDADRKKEVLARLTNAKRLLALGDKQAADAHEAIPGGNVTKVRKLTDDADASYRGARLELGRLKRILRAEEPERAQALALLTTLDKAQYRVLFEAAKFFWDQRVYARAEEYAARASYIDPVDPALLELRSEVREHRIHYRFSDVTNARPH